MPMQEIFEALSDEDWQVTNENEALEKIKFFKECADWCKIYR